MMFPLRSSFFSAKTKSFKDLDCSKLLIAFEKNTLPAPETRIHKPNFGLSSSNCMKDPSELVSAMINQWT